MGASSRDLSGSDPADRIAVVLGVRRVTLSVRQSPRDVRQGILSDTRRAAALEAARILEVPAGDVRTGVERVTSDGLATVICNAT